MRRNSGRDRRRDRDRDDRDQDNGQGGGAADFAATIIARNIDGAGANEDHPDWGAAHQELLRLAPAAYADGVGAPVADLPNPREISNALSWQTEDMPSAQGVSDLLWVWGQFIDHDLDLTEAGETEFQPIIAPFDDPVFEPTEAGPAIIPFTRVDPIEGTGVDGPRQYENDITAFLDASMVYGSDDDTAAALRGEGGYLRLGEDGLLPEGETGVLAGDVRAAENIALTSLHVLFVREHNRWVDILSADHPGLSDEQLFDAARQRVEAEIQAVTFNEFLPIIVGEGVIPAYSGYDPAVNPGISVEFSTAAYRFGHTLLSSDIGRLNEDGSAISAGAISLREAFFNPDVIGVNGGIDPILRGLADGYAQELDTHVVEDVRSFLFAENGSTGMDLAAINIARGRDLGVASYNDLRDALGLGRVQDFADITSDPVLAAQLEAVYGDVDSIDAWVGGLAEDAANGGMVGELFGAVIVDQFVRLRDGDPLWSQAGHMSDAEIAALWDVGLADLIEANTDVGAIQDNVFYAYERQGGDAGADRLVGDDARDLLLGEAGDDKLFGRAGDDQLEGGDGADKLMGGDGADRLYGGAGNDRLYVGAGADALVYDEAGFGRDVVIDFELGRDVLEIDRALATNFSDLAVRDMGRDGVKVSFGDGMVVLRGVSAREFSEADVTFVGSGADLSSALEAFNISTADDSLIA